MEFIRIPNLSRQYQEDWKTNGLPEKAANHIRDWIESLKLENTKIEMIKD
jgi:hypothetical protein